MKTFQRFLGAENKKWRAQREACLADWFQTGWCLDPMEKGDVKRKLKELFSQENLQRHGGTHNLGPVCNPNRVSCKDKMRVRHSSLLTTIQLWHLTCSSILAAVGAHRCEQNSRKPQKCLKNTLQMAKTLGQRYVELGLLLLIQFHLCAQMGKAWKNLGYAYFHL